MRHVDNRLIENIFREHEAPLRAYLVGKTGSLEEAQDIVQETFLKIHLAGGLEDIKQPRAFLFRVATNVLIDHIRRRHARIPGIRPNREVEDQGVESASPEMILHSRELQMAFRRAIEELPARRRQVIVMHKLLHKSYGEIAAELGITRSMVEQHMTRALRHCRDRLQHLR